MYINSLWDAGLSFRKSRLPPWHNRTFRKGQLSTPQSGSRSVIRPLLAWLAQYLHSGLVWIAEQVGYWIISDFNSRLGPHIVWTNWEHKVK